ncbi:MipA/OmpV family protein [Trinickia symbiotica]|uniref:MipA/OmpV family protein n=1 Tax=Trinickia symbiotica TaxID=863227 RepID=A0A2T3Y1J2_9BURK|nr:MipA/OmpV family protein [Trinickia symbiotica]PTB22609.1 MipA/OmpV family protein [Trinickia symbiotica]
MIVKKSRGRERQSLLLFVCLLSLSAPAWADGEGAGQPEADGTGLAILNNATNVTHWGLGAGVGIEQSPYKGYGSKVSPIPLLYFDDKWVHVLGTTIDLKIGSWRGVSVALRGQFALFDGYKGSDAPILNGMQNRNGAFWYGPALAWNTSFGTLSGNFLLGGNKGERAKIDYGKTFAFGSFAIEPHVGVEWLGSKYVDYYYGVRQSEVRSGRPAYNGTSTWNVSVGSRVGYALTRHQKIILDVGVSHLGSGITDSPLVGKRFIPEARIGYMYQFK